MSFIHADIARLADLAGTTRVSVAPRARRAMSLHRPIVESLPVIGAKAFTLLLFIASAGLSLALLNSAFGLQLGL